MKKLKQLYLNSIEEFASARTLAFLGIMGALAIVLNWVASIDIGPYVKIGFSGLPNRLVEAMFGPVVGAFFGGAMDVIKYFLKPSGPFFFGFTFDAMLAGILYGSILYKRPVSFWRILFADFLVKLIVNCGFNTLWISILYGKSIIAILPLRILKNAIMLPIDAIIQFAALTVLTRIVAQFHFTSKAV